MGRSTGSCGKACFASPAIRCKLTFHKIFIFTKHVTAEVFICIISGDCRCFSGFLGVIAPSWQVFGCDSVCSTAVAPDIPACYTRATLFLPSGAEPEL